MTGMTAFKAVLAVLTLALLSFIGIACTADVVYGLLEMWDTLWGRIVVADLGLALLLFSAWAVYRDGWLKGLAWTVAFVVLGSAAVALYALVNLRGTGTAIDMARFFLGRHAAAAAPAVVKPAVLTPGAVIAGMKTGRPATV